MKPIIVVNFKTYKESTGKGAEKLLKQMKSVKGNFIACPQFTDLYLGKKYKIPVFSQHVDPIDPGRNTGYITPFALKSVGAKGSLINHSEHKIKFSLIKKTINILKLYGLKSLVCCEDYKEARKIAKLSPDFIAVEPPELIGTGLSVTDAEPEIIERTVKVVKKVNSRVKVLCGAGISGKKDVERSIELGADGILVASGVVKAKNRVKVLKDLCLL
jgi:triosephosphate isomerase